MKLWTIDCRYVAAGIGACLSLLLALAPGCASSSHVLLGTVRDPVAVEQVKVYASAPQRYEEVALLNASSGGSLGGDQEKMNTAVEQLRKEAAALGANGVLLRSSAERTAVSVGTGTGVGRSAGRWGSGVGLGVSVPVSSTAVSAVAIYVLEE